MKQRIIRKIKRYEIEPTSEISQSYNIHNNDFMLIDTLYYKDQLIAYNHVGVSSESDNVLHLENINKALIDYESVSKNFENNYGLENSDIVLNTE